MQRILILSVLLFSISWGKANTVRDSLPRAQEVNTILEISEKYICNPHWLNTEEWKVFVRNIRSENVLQLSVQDFRTHFNKEAKKLPFTHYYLSAVQTKNQGTKEEDPYFELKSIDDNTAHLIIRSFVSDAQTMFKLTKEIQEKGYKNLIIDMRDNTGGTLDAPVVLARFLTQESIDAGIYMTQPWFAQNDHYPTKEEIQQLPFLEDLSLQGFRSIVKKSPAFRMVIPGHDQAVFQGKVYVLTNSITGSACEPVVDLLKKKGLATIVGQRTAGAMLSGEYIPVSNSLRLFLPVADYMTAEGSRIDKVGVLPDVKKSHEEALPYVLNQIAKK